MTTFAERLALGKVFEDEVAIALEARGFAVCPFGQAQMSEEVRAKLKESASPIRWLPDLLAVKTGTAVLIDAKLDMAGAASANHCIEQAAFQAHEAMYAGRDGIAFGYAFSDGLVCGLPAAAMHGTRIESGGVRGSGTPMRLIPKSAMLSFDDAFGVPL